MTAKQRKAYIDQLINAIVNGELTPDDLKAEPVETGIVFAPKPITVVLKGFTANGVTKAGLCRFAPKVVTFKGDKAAKFYLSGNAVYAPEGVKVANVEVTIKPEPMLNKDGSVKHSKGGHSFKTANTVVLKNGAKFFVDGYYAAK